MFQLRVTGTVNPPSSVCGVGTLYSPYCRLYTGGVSMYISTMMSIARPAREPAECRAAARGGASRGGGAILRRVPPPGHQPTSRSGASSRAVRMRRRHRAARVLPRCRGPGVTRIYEWILLNEIESG